MRSMLARAARTALSPAVKVLDLIAVRCRGGGARRWAAVLAKWERQRG